LINTRSDRVPEADQARFIEATETEILALHDGNIKSHRTIKIDMNTNAILIVPKYGLLLIIILRISKVQLLILSMIIALLLKSSSEE